MLYSYYRTYYSLRVTLWFVASPPRYDANVRTTTMKWAFMLSRVGFSIPTLHIFLLVGFIEWLYVGGGSGVPSVGYIFHVPGLVSMN